MFFFFNLAPSTEYVDIPSYTPVTSDQMGTDDYLIWFSYVAGTHSYSTHILFMLRVLIYELIKCLILLY
jgi:hypothetical protein